MASHEPDSSTANCRNSTLAKLSSRADNDPSSTSDRDNDQDNNRAQDEAVSSHGRGPVAAFSMAHALSMIQRRKEEQQRKNEVQEQEDMEARKERARAKKKRRRENAKAAKAKIRAEKQAEEAQECDSSSKGNYHEQGTSTGMASSESVDSRVSQQVTETVEESHNRSCDQGIQEGANADCNQSQMKKRPKRNLDRRAKEEKNLVSVDSKFRKKKKLKFRGKFRWRPEKSNKPMSLLPRALELKKSKETQGTSQTN